MFWIFFSIFALCGVVAIVGSLAAVILCIRLSGWERRMCALALTVVGLLGIAVGGYMEVTLRSIAASTGQPIQGLIGQPVPNAGGDHEYTAHGEEYEVSAFRRPFVCGAALLLTVGTLFTLVARIRGLRIATPVFYAVAATVGGLFVFWIVREFTAWEIFI